MTELENLEVGENETTENVGTPDEEQDNSHTEEVESSKEARYKEQLKGSRDEALRLRELAIQQGVNAAKRDARTLLDLHEADPKLADEVAKQFGYDDFADAKSVIDKKEFTDDNEGIRKTSDADFKENFEKLYQERRAKETDEEAREKATKLITKNFKDKELRERAETYFKKIAGDKKLSYEEAEEFAEMATLYVNKDTLKKEKYEESIGNYASTGLGMGKKAGSESTKMVVRNGRLVTLDSNNDN